jgi:F-type H+-transporting ATPase subunit a
MAEHHSILFGPVNALWAWFLQATGLVARLGNVAIPEHVVMALFVLAVITLLVVPLRRGLSLENPGKLQQIMELVVKAIYDLIEDNVGHGGGRRYLPFVGTFAVFIFLSNICGLFFFLQPPTGNPNTTFALALTAWSFYHLAGIRHHGLAYFKQFLGPIPAMFPLFLPLEIISHTARALSLGLRLFGNMMGDHLAAGVFMALVPFVIPMPMMALGIFASLMQTFIFVMLTTVYIAGAEASEH